MEFLTRQFKCDPHQAWACDLSQFRGLLNDRLRPFLSTLNIACDLKVWIWNAAYANALSFDHG